ncbi:MAG: hypothetical protein E3J90_06560 [Promethearchaeota archaeon]|nr:MAG: hypothetical protein E3J90_06560 [Candidatus Lokiarchaeota archaeon]
MRRKDLRRLVYFVILIYIIATIFGFFIILNFNDEDFTFRLFFTLIPFILAIPAAYLSWGFQRRMSYIRALRSIYIEIVKTISNSIEYTFFEKPQEDKFYKVLISLESSIDHLRMIFKNKKVKFYKFKCENCQKEIYSKTSYKEIECEICEKKYIIKEIKKIEKVNLFIYPIESIKEIYKEFDRIRVDKIFNEREIVRKKLVTLWKRVRATILEEFDRVIPTKIETLALTEKDIAFIKK